MPNRLIREGFLDSEAIHALGDAAECFFHRLMLTADDAGRMDGRVEILRARLFPLDISRRASDVEKTLSECVAQGLVIPYERKGQRFLQVAKWQRCSPCVTSKYPWVDGSFRIEYRKVETRDGAKDFVVTSLGIPIPLARDSDGIGAVIPPMYGDGDVDVDGSIGRQAGRFGDFWNAYPKHVKRKPTEAKWKAKRLDGMADEIVADVRKRVRADKRWLDGFIPDPLTYITQERWQDEMQGGPPAPSAVPRGKPAGPSETPLERAVAYARQQFHFGAIDETERDRLIAEATAKHREAK